MKYKIVAILVWVMIGSIGVFGQQNSTRKLDRQQKGDQRFIKLAEKLELSPVQKKELFELMKAGREDRRASRDNRPSQEERIAAKQQLNQKVADILNEEQLEKYLKIESKRSATRKVRTEKRQAIKDYGQINIAPVMKGQRLKLDELLSEDEIATIDRIRTQYKPLKGDEARGRGSKISKEDRMVLRSIAKEHAEDLKSLMTEIEDDRKGWRKDIKGIKREGEKGKRRIKSKVKVQKEKRDKNKSKDNRRNKRSKSKHVKTVKFLLMDPSN